MWFNWQLATSRRINFEAEANVWPANRINGLPLSFSSRSSGKCRNAWVGIEDNTLWLRSNSTKLVRPAKAVGSICRRAQRCKITRCKWVSPSRRNSLATNCESGLPLKSSTCIRSKSVYDFSTNFYYCFLSFSLFGSLKKMITWIVLSNPLDGTSVQPAWWQETLSFPPFHLQTQGLRQVLLCSTVVHLIEPTHPAKTTKKTASFLIPHGNLIFRASFDSSMTFLSNKSKEKTSEKYLINVSSGYYWTHTHT